MSIDTTAYANELLAKVVQLETENQKLREQRDAANAHNQFLNRVIAGDAE